MQPSHTYASGGGFTVTVFVTDGNGGSDTDTATATVQAQPSITLSTSGSKVKGQHTASLTWSGVASANVDIYRNGVSVTTVPNGASPYTDRMNNRGRGSYTYQVCEAGTSRCSNTDPVSF